MKRIALGRRAAASNRLEPLLEVAAVPGASEHGAHVERVDGAAEDVGDVAFDDARARGLPRSRSCPRPPRRPSGVVLAAAAGVWITRSSSRLRPISGSILPRARRARGSSCRSRAGPARAIRPSSPTSSLSASVAHRLRALGDAVRDVVDDVEPRDALLVQGKYTACESSRQRSRPARSRRSTSFLPEDCTCRIARWITRWKPSVGWRVDLLAGERRGVLVDELGRGRFRSSSTSPAGRAGPRPPSGCRATPAAGARR